MRSPGSRQGAPLLKNTPGGVIIKYRKPGGKKKRGLSLGGNMADDNWKHRSKGMVCATCMYWVVKEGEEMRTNGPKLGRCRRYAPTMKGWPAVFDTDWCGDHRLDENKI
jgi:hypothetical protein